MPLLYKNNKPNMKSVTELDQSEAIFIIATQPMYSFTQEQANRMVQIVKDYYNPNQSDCASCGSGMRTAKDSIIKLYQENTELINSISQGVQPVVETTKKKKK